MSKAKNKINGIMAKFRTVDTFTVLWWNKKRFSDGKRLPKKLPTELTKEVGTITLGPLPARTLYGRLRKM